MRTWVRFVMRTATLGMFSLASCAASGGASRSAAHVLPGVTPYYESVTKSHWRQHRKPARDERARALASIAKGAERLSNSLMTQDPDLQLAAETPNSSPGGGRELVAALEGLRSAAQRGDLSDVRLCYARALELYAAR